MSQPHQSDPIEENIETHPVKLAIGIIVGAAALIVGIILLAHFAIGAYSERSRTGDAAMSAAAIDRRIAPEATVAIDANAPAPSAAMPSVAPPTAKLAVAMTPAARSAAGKPTFDKVCTVCHSTGVAGAPKFGDKAAWAPRIARGKDSLYHSALNGKGAMPAKGGNPALSDADVEAAVDYMMAAAK